MRRVPLLLASLVAACADPIASLDAQTTVNNASVRARINFTTLTPSVDQSNRVTLAFTNPEGDSMTFGLTPSGTLSQGNYDIDGTTNTFASTFGITESGATFAVSVTSTFGFINLTSVGIDASGILTSLSGEYHVNFVTGGAGVGAINCCSE